MKCDLSVGGNHSKLKPIWNVYNLFELLAMPVEILVSFFKYIGIEIQFEFCFVAGYGYGCAVFLINFPLSALISVKGFNNFRLAH